MEIEVEGDENVKHILIPVAAIHPNPHRNFKRNPIRDDQVAKLVESIGRTGFWDNVVVRDYPGRKGEYQLAYGHNRLAALKKAGITEARWPVAALNEWDMYQLMRDENETQQEVTPAIAFENVEVGVDMMEAAFKAVGPAGTWEQFNRALGRAVSDDTARHPKDHTFETVRNQWFEKGTIGRRFITEVIETRRLSGNAINTVIQSHYGRKLEEAKQKEAEAKEREADAKAAQAKAEKDEKTAAKLREQAVQAKQEAEAMKAEARKIGAGLVEQTILLSFENTTQMTDFAAAVRGAAVPKAHHRAAMEYIRREEKYGKNMAQAVDSWWYERSGQKEADATRAAKETAFKTFRRRVKDGDLRTFLLGLGNTITDLSAEVDLVLTGHPVRFYENEKHREALAKKCRALRQKLAELEADLGHHAEGQTTATAGAGANGARGLPYRN